jgi:protease-4
MEDVYTTFVGRVAAGRNMTVAQVQPLAQGRVWTGEKAKQLGLVDELGGLDAALAEARTLAKVDATAELEIYPPSPTLRDFLQGFTGGVSSPLGTGVDQALATIAVVDPKLAAAAKRLVALVLSFQTTRIQAVAVLPVIR